MDLRKILFPFSWLYWAVTAIRNHFYDKGLFTSYTFDVPVIAIGNLSTGGTGKTPQTEYLIRLLSGRYRVATLSRGYKRKSKGYVLAGDSANAAILGDEPYQFHSKFPNIRVAVDADRKNGIGQLLSLSPRPEVILLDDAYQHRRVKAGFYILLTAYGDLYADDFILPAGNLREGRSGAKRADVIIVTKCPPELSQSEQVKIRAKLKAQPGQKVYFTHIDYDMEVHSEEGHRDITAIKGNPKVLVAGIAKPKPFFDHLSEEGDIVLTFPDHHDFTDKDIEEINQQANQKMIITTEKDFVRLKGRLPKEQLFYLPIRSRFLSGGDDFDKTILDYVGTSTANR
ncbi:tetraacyldisaccharide 4'-kinase [Flavobacterium sp. MFBS3-15]|uniref:tetraacyldisaccharide 4'-kinase n=1 Tax=Flavobacterium sp. MFBS3-15 TaxID=2989816 RepID=UPI0022354678|nr:tetraacyldisaccharide 4'-kinase [Flavobacterium sp. MFBS3-15]MCW4470465.1 tetraacyldisaccharide 4'-kinase [Flavobacterium sp. MFBS3-15]